MTLLGAGLTGWAIGSLGTAVVLCVVVIARDDDRVAQLRGELAAVRQELKRVLRERRKQCMDAYTNGVAMGMETRGKPRHTTVILDAQTYHDIRRQHPEVLEVER